MNALSRKFTSVLAVTAVTASMALASPVSAAVRSFGKTYTVTATVKGGKNLTVLLISGSGRLLASKKVTGTNQKISLKSPATASIGGTSLQLVNSAGASKGAYFGPVTIGHKGTKSTSASRVYTRLKQSISTSVKLGTLTVKKVGAGKQGYAVASATSSSADTSVGAQVSASKGRPTGVGTFGKTSGVAVKSYGVSATAIGDPCQPANTATCGPEGKEIGPPNPGQPTPGQPNAGQPNSGQPTAQQGSVVNKDETLGGDADDDGIPNAFDVNDDGDAVLDQADLNSPTPNAGANCQVGASFNIFTNFKNTATNMSGNINAYGKDDSTATDPKIATALTNTMSIVMQPIASVCGSNVTKSEFKGVGTLPYAPVDYVDITGKSGGTGDYQWTVGNGQISGSPVTGLAPFTFTGSNQISGQDVLMQRVTTADGNVYEFAGTMGFVFVTHPLPLRYSTDNGSSWSNFTFSGGSASYGTAQKIGLAIGTKLTVEFAVPQRLAFDGEGGTYWDLGNMTYSPDAPNAFGGGNGPGKCDSQSGTDSTADSAVTSTARTFQLAFTLGTCFTEKGRSWGTSGQELQGGVDIQVLPVAGGGNSAQKLGISAQ